MIAVTAMEQQLWLFEDARHEVVRRPACPTWRPRLPKLHRPRPAGCQILPPIEAFLAREARSPEMQILLGEQDVPDNLIPLDRRQRIKIRHDLRSGRRDARKKMPEDLRAILRDDELSCEWLRADEIERLDALVAQRAAEVRALWSAAEERNRRLGITADERDPNEHVQPPVIEMIGSLIRLEMSE